MVGASLFTARKFGPRDTVYRSRLSGRKYVVARDEKDRTFIRVYVNGRCIYGGNSPERAFDMIELDDLVE
jgi:hypothetical protein